MHDEIDILRILKQLRIAQFAVDLILTPGQKRFVRWFDQYKLNLSSDEESSDSNELSEAALTEMDEKLDSLNKFSLNDSKRSMKS